MPQSYKGKTNENPTLITLVVLGVMAVILVVLLGVLPYRNQPASPTPDPNRQYQFGVTDYLTGNYKAAVDDFTRAIDGQYVPLEKAKYNRGLAYYSYGLATEDEVSLDNSIADFQGALDLDRHYLEVYPALGWAYYKKASFYKEDEQTPFFQQSFDIFQKGLELYTKLGQTDAEIYDGLGWTYFKLGNDQAAINNFKLALNFSPEMEDAQAGLNEARADLQK